jgi:hypothetical protein
MINGQAVVLFALRSSDGAVQNADGAIVDALVASGGLPDADEDIILLDG